MQLPLTMNEKLMNVILGALDSGKYTMPRSPKPIKGYTIYRIRIAQFAPLDIIYRTNLKRARSMDQALQDWEKFKDKLISENRAAIVAGNIQYRLNGSTAAIGYRDPILRSITGEYIRNGTVETFVVPDDIMKDCTDYIQANDEAAFRKYNEERRNRLIQSKYNVIK